MLNGDEKLQMRRKIFSLKEYFDFSIKNFVKLNVAIFTASVLAPSARAQSNLDFGLAFFKPQTIISPTIPNGFDRGGNIGIDQALNPDYNQLPIHVGSLDLYPQLDTFVGATSNVYLTTSNPKPALLVGSQLSFLAAADWGNSGFVAYGRDWQNIWVGNSARSQNQGNIDASYQIELTSSLKAAIEGAFFVYGDNNAIGTMNNLGSVLQITDKSFGATRLQYESGRFSEIFSVDVSHYNLNPINSYLTGFEPTYYDNHTVVRASSQTQYAFSPNTAIFGQVSIYRDGYSSILPGGQPNYNSTSYRGIAGLSLDIPGLLRGQVAGGIGYREFDASIYKPTSGFVISTKVDFFPDDDDNFTVLALRDFDDGAIYSLAPVKYTEFAFIYERRMRLNFFAGLQANDYTQTALAVVPQGQVGVSQTVYNYGASIYFKYMFNHHFSAKIEFGGERYINNNYKDIIADYESNKEFRGLLTFSYRP
jgi:hypothetical protein